MSFNKWLEEKEGYSSRKERLLEDFEIPFFNNDLHTKLMMWLEAAYNQGTEDGMCDGCKNTQIMVEKGW